MRNITFVTGNNTKLDDARSVLSSSDIKIIGEKIDLPEIQTLIQKDIVNNKAEYAFLKLKIPLLVDDTAFYIEGYEKFPGTLTKYINQTLGISGLSKLYKEGQNAFFLTMICYIDGINKIVTEGKLVGTLTKKVSSRFNSDTPLNSIFIPEGYNKPLIDLNKSEVGNLHRVRALEKFKKEINRLINKNI